MAKCTPRRSLSPPQTSSMGGLERSLPFHMQRRCFDTGDLQNALFVLGFFAVGYATFGVVARRQDQQMKRCKDQRVAKCLKTAETFLHQLSSSENMEKVEAAHGIAMLAGLGLEEEVKLREMGALRAVIPLLHSPSMEVQEAAAAALGSFTEFDEESRRSIRVGGGLGVIIRLLRSKSPKVQASAAYALNNCSYNLETEDDVRTQGGITALVELLSSEVETVQARAAEALATLCIERANAEEARSQGAMGILVRLLQVPSRDVRASAAEALESCAGSDELARDEIHYHGGLPALVAVVQSDQDDEVKARAVMTLYYCAIHGEAIARDLVGTDVMETTSFLMERSSILPDLLEVARDLHEVLEATKKSLEAKPQWRGVDTGVGWEHLCTHTPHTPTRVTWKLLRHLQHLLFLPYHHLPLLPPCQKSRRTSRKETQRRPCVTFSRTHFFVTCLPLHIQLQILLIL
eukprot:TRINITY_DN1615_c0_g1_i2.p1 TRINITY_DN1615_c0_g1~~TRINITY_DN1615_c0_g1_i2.p1  ORF type:complete len:509 (+),score=82.67 TRINITY_DN1615_c0_g1_i2:140-1528(+)